MPPRASENPMLFIRRPPSQIFSMESYVEQGRMTQEQYELLIKHIQMRSNIILGGETGSGKTEFVKYLASHTKENEKVILFLGRIAAEKSIDVILDQMPEIFKAHPNYRFLIVGTGPSEDDLKKQAKKLNIEDKVIFTGKVQWSDVPKYYTLADVFVNASVTETQGLTFIEAMAAQIPVVCKYANNLSEFIHNGQNGLFVHKNSEFKDAIANVIENKELSNTLIEGGNITAKEYSIEVFGDRLETLYSEVIKLHKNVKDAQTKEERNEIKEKIYNEIDKKLKDIR